MHITHHCLLLLIQFILDWGTYVGGSGSNTGVLIDYEADQSGNVYGTGAYTNGFPVSNGTFKGGTYDMVVYKLSSDGGLLLYATFIGGTSATLTHFYDGGHAIAVNSKNEVIVAGTSGSTDFPTTANAYSQAYGGGVFDNVVVHLDVTGANIKYSSFIGGSLAETPYDIELFSDNQVGIVGYTKSTDFPITSGAFQTSFVGSNDAIIQKMDLSQAGTSSLLYSTYLGGIYDDKVRALAINGSGEIYFTGHASSPDFPITSGSHSKVQDVILGKILPNGNGAGDMVYNIMIPGIGGDYSHDIGLDKYENVYIFGTSNSTDYPKTNEFVEVSGAVTGDYNNFVTKFDKNGTLKYSTLVGSSFIENAGKIEVTETGEVYAVAQTLGNDFPTTTCQFLLILQFLQWYSLICVKKEHY